MMDTVDEIIELLPNKEGKEQDLPDEMKSESLRRELLSNMSKEGDIALTTSTPSLLSTAHRTIVTNQAMGARCAVAADFDSDGKLDLVSASSNDHAVSWYKNLGRDNSTGMPTFSIKRKITWSSLGSRIVTVADINQDGWVDVIGASYYDSSLRWFENVPQYYNNEKNPDDPRNGEVEDINFEEHLISDGVNEGQGVTVADLDNDGDPDIITASSGDNTIAVFKNIDSGIFCEIKEVVDDNAIGVRTVIAADLNGDGWLDLASASKDDSTIAWYPNKVRNVTNSDGSVEQVGGYFEPNVKRIVSAGEESSGAYSLVAADVDLDGDQDLIVASNGNDHVSLWRNVDGKGTFEKTLIFDDADFVLSVTALDLDRDGDIDVASASFFDGHINWYENVDGKGYEWKNHTIYVGIQGHYVSKGDMDGDGDDDLIAVTHAENTVAVYFAKTECDHDEGEQMKPECCHEGTEWSLDAQRCISCANAFYGVGSGLKAACVACPTNACSIDSSVNSNYNLIPATCSGITGCSDPLKSIEQCSCSEDSIKSPQTDGCVLCPDGQIRPDATVNRSLDTLGNYSAWELEQGMCTVKPSTVTILNQNSSPRIGIIIPLVVAFFILISFLVFVIHRMRQTIKYKTRDVNNAPRDGLVGLVFTDIEGSTALWDESKQTMSTALEIHHDVIRKVIDRYNAYEVKTIGDAFMIAVKCSDDSGGEDAEGCCDVVVKLANDIQVDLLNAEWPVELANMPTTCTEFFFNRFERNGKKREPKLTFRGLRVRVGVHAGVHLDKLDDIVDEISRAGGVETARGSRNCDTFVVGGANSNCNGATNGGEHQVQCKYDNITKGFDYYGPATNATARIEALAFGGQTLISTEVHSRLSKDFKDTACIFQTVGGVHVKGVSEEVFLYQCLPKELKGRAFRGVVRRRDSEGTPVTGEDDSQVDRSSSIVSINTGTQQCRPSIYEEDMRIDIGLLTPVQLMKTIVRLRKECREMEYKMEEAEYKFAVGVPVMTKEEDSDSTAVNSDSTHPPQDQDKLEDMDLQNIKAIRRESILSGRF